MLETAMWARASSVASGRARANLAAMYLAEGNLKTSLRYLRDLPAELERIGDVSSLQAALKNLEMLNSISERWTNQSAE